MAHDHVAGTSPSDALLDPTGDVAVDERQIAPRLDSLDGATIGLLDNAKPNADRFLETVGEVLQDAHGVADVVSRNKHSAAVSAGELLPDLVDACDAVVNAYGDCGSCTAWCIHDSVALEQEGVPTATINSDEFARLGQSEARSLGFPGLPIVLVDHPMGTVSPDVVRTRASDAVPELVAATTTPREELMAEYRGMYLGENEELTSDDLYCPL